MPSFGIIEHHERSSSRRCGESIFLTVNERSPTLYPMDSQHLKKIQAFYRSQKRMPSYSELMAVVGFRSKNAAYKLVERFVQRDWLEKDATGRLLPGRLFQDLPLLGTVSAGFPSPADEELTDTMSLDDYLISNKEATYVLKVNGNSMLDAGILPGDMLLVKRGAAVFLEAANKDCQPIHPQEELQIAAVVRAVIRKY